jgi:hypothetical protein
MYTEIRTLLLGRSRIQILALRLVQVLTAANLKMTSFCDIETCNLVEVNGVLPPLSGRFVYFNKNTRRYIPEGSYLFAEIFMVFLSFSRHILE